jgi:hypothetical protein
VRVHSQQSLDTHLHTVCHTAFQTLLKFGAIKQGGTHFVGPTPAGEIMSQALVEVQAMEIMTNEIAHDASQDDVLKSIARMVGLQRPVRRLEKKCLNQTQ